MRSLRSHHTRLALAATVAAAVLCASGGCWEKIEFKGPDSSVAQAQQEPLPPADSGEAAAQNDVPASETDGTADRLTADSAPGTAAETAPAESSGDTPPAGDPYAMPAEPPAASAENTSTTEEAAPADGDVEATAVAATVDTEAAARAPNTRRAAWTLGRGLSLAALANDRGVAAKSVPKWLEEARAAAEELGTSVNELPERPAASADAPASRQVLNYLFVDGQRIGHDLQDRYGADHAALVELGVKSSLLVLLYEPGSSTVENISEVLKQATSRAGLPAELLQPLLELLSKKATPKEVRAGIQQFHADVDRYLTSPVEP